MKKGLLAAFGAYLFWGFSPIYWKLLNEIPALEILLHRIFWSLPFLLIIIVIKNGWTNVISLFQNILKKKIYFLSATLLALNWFLFIWSVMNGFIVEASLGYFINPLVNVLLGVVFLKEQIRRFQWIAIFLALTGVVYLTFNYGHFPWIALSLAASFSFYGLIRKTASLGSMDGLAFEMIVIFLPAVFLFSIMHSNNQLVFNSVDSLTKLLLIVTGMVTALPLLFFAYGARKIPYSTLGFIQYIAPTIQFLLGVFLYNEVFGLERFIGFSFIWAALLIYSIENIFNLRKVRIIPTVQ